jgi:hypothetical protein
VSFLVLLSDPADFEVRAARGGRKGAGGGLSGVGWGGAGRGRTSGRGGSARWAAHAGRKGAQEGRGWGGARVGRTTAPVRRSGCVRKTYALIF